MTLLAQLPDPATLTDAELAIWLRTAAKVLGRRRYDWAARHARPDQLEPDEYRVWLILAGRGWGKTRTGAETVRLWCAEQPGGAFAAIGRTASETMEICFQHPKSGLLKVIPPEQIVSFNKSTPLLTLANGSTIQGFSAQEPDALRGPAFDGVWGDEFAAWPAKLAQSVYDMAWLCLREAPQPRMVLTTTPKPLAHVKKILTRAEKKPRKVTVTRGRTLDNRKNLSRAALEELLEQYEGTRLGRQELDAEVLEDVEGALWRLAWIEAGRVRPDWIDSDGVKHTELPDMVRRIISVDPCETVSETSDECGIIALGTGVDNEDYVLGDRSAKVAGMVAARRIWQAYADFEAQLVIVEGSGFWMRDMLVMAWEQMQEEGILPPGDAPIEVVDALVSKKVRAEPIAGRYERQPPRVHHVGLLAKLESQQTTWTPESGDKSPDRMDALVHGVAWLRSKAKQKASMATAVGKPRTRVRNPGLPGRASSRLGVPGRTGRPKT